MLRHLHSRAVGAPLLIERRKLDVILAGIHGRIGLAKPGEVECDEDSEDYPTRPPFSLESGIATIAIHGTLLSRGAGIEAMSGACSYQTIRSELRMALEDPRVEAILLDVDSAGGEYAGAIELAQEILAARGAKPLAACVHYLAASAAYALASAAGRVVIPESGQVGSIGVVALHVDQSARDAAEGLAFTYLYRGSAKIDGTPHAPLADEARARFELDLDTAYGRFVAHVAEARGISADAIRSTEAALFTGPAAIDRGLADAIGGADEARAWLASQIEERKAMKDLEEKLAAAVAEKARLEGENAKLVAALAERDQAADAAYVASIKAAAVAAQAPLTVAQLAAVEKQLAAGNREAAHAIGDALVAAAQASGSVSASATTKIVPIAASPAPTETTAERARRRALERPLPSETTARKARKES